MAFLIEVHIPPPEAARDGSVRRALRLDVERGADAADATDAADVADVADVADAVDAADATEVEEEREQAPFNCILKCHSAVKMPAGERTGVEERTHVAVVIPKQSRELHRVLTFGVRIAQGKPEPVPPKARAASAVSRAWAPPAKQYCMKPKARSVLRKLCTRQARREH